MALRNEEFHSDVENNNRDWEIISRDIEEYYDSEDSDFEDDYYQTYETYQTMPMIVKESQDVSNEIYDFQSNCVKKYRNNINVEEYEGCHASNIRLQQEKKMANEQITINDTYDRETTEQVINPHRRLMLFNLLKNGCISTGKIANVYHGTSETGEEFAIKTYKPTISVSIDHDRYLNEDFRFRNGYFRHDPHKIIKTCAKNEMRNLNRMHINGLNVPEPIALQSHVVVMSFIGTDGRPAPKLKDIELNESKARKIYGEIVILMWKMYNKCKLVHANLSEFNMLYQDGNVYIIDVSQSVEQNHPKALEFLKADCINITHYFQRKGVTTMTIAKLLDFITDPDINELNIDEYLEKTSQIADRKSSGETTPNEQIAEVFKNVYIPKPLTDVIDSERYIIIAKSGEVGVSESENVESSDESGDEFCDTYSDDRKCNFVNSAKSNYKTNDEKLVTKKMAKKGKAKKRKCKIGKHIQKRKVHKSK